MITFYSFSDDAPERIDPASASLPSAPVSTNEPSPGEPRLWLDLVHPTPEECVRLSMLYAIPLEHLRAALDSNERPRMEFANGTLLIVARAPLTNEDNPELAIRTCSLAVILTPHVVITVCLNESVVQTLLCRKILGKGPRLAERLVLTLLLRISTTFIEQLHRMDDYVTQLEQNLVESMRNQGIVQMLHVEKSLIYFLTALKGNQSVLEKIRYGALLTHGIPFPSAPAPGDRNATTLTATEEERELLDDVLIENRQATDMAEIFTQIMGSLGDAFESIVSNNLNKVMKVLTGLTVVFMIPSIIGALYGMNVALPFQENPYAFTVLCVACLGLSLAIYRALKKMDWM